MSVEGGPHDADFDVDGAPKVPAYYVLFAWLAWWRRGVRHQRGLVYAEVDGQRLKLDVYRPARVSGRPLPAAIHVHGGAWVLASRREQGLPLLNHLATNGWIGFNIDYRLSPRVALPAHVEDVKRAVVWVREHARELGVDPEFIALTGGSAGGHLTALAALTADDTSLQPGFEDTDAHVDAAVPFYGVYDFLALDEPHHRHLRRGLEWLVVKERLDRRPELFRRLSPLHRIHADAPAFFVVHGSGDTLVPAAESRAFVRRLRGVSRQPVLYAEMQGAQHGLRRASLLALYPGHSCDRAVPGGDLCDAAELVGRNGASGSARSPSGRSEVCRPARRSVLACRQAIQRWRTADVASGHG